MIATCYDFANERIQAVDTPEGTVVTYRVCKRDDMSSEELQHLSMSMRQAMDMRATQWPKNKKSYRKVGRATPPRSKRQGWTGGRKQRELHVW